MLKRLKEQREELQRQASDNSNSQVLLYLYKSIHNLTDRIEQEETKLEEEKATKLWEDWYETMCILPTYTSTMLPR